jgi:Raf kinase inhibitor-like YbhB/YbcL family protein
MIGRFLRPLRSGTAKLAGNDARIATRSTIVVSSREFESGTTMPGQYRGGDGIFPPIAWSNIPADAVELVMIVEDVDVPFPAPLVHAIAYGIAPNKGGFEAGEIPNLSRGNPSQIPGALLGKAIAFGPGYAPPTPIPGHGPHRYVYQVFALDVRLAPFAKPPLKREILAAMAGHSIARGAIVGLAEA